MLLRQKKIDCQKNHNLYLFQKKQNLSQMSNPTFLHKCKTSSQDLDGKNQACATFKKESGNLVEFFKLAFFGLLGFSGFWYKERNQQRISQKITRNMTTLNESLIKMIPYFLRQWGTSLQCVGLGA